MTLQRILPYTAHPFLFKESLLCGLDSTDHFIGECDRLALVSGDSDLLPVVRRVAETAAGRQILVIAPPGQHVSDLQKLVAKSDSLSIARIGLERVARCQLR